MIKFSLALVVCCFADSTEASNFHYNKLPAGFYGGHYNPSYYGGYGSYGQDHFFPYNLGRKKHYSDNPHTHTDDDSNQTSHGDNIWDPHDGQTGSSPVVPPGWFSATQQYSPPKIPFVPNAKHPKFAICKYVDASGLGSGEIQIGQLPGQPSMIRGAI